MDNPAAILSYATPGDRPDQGLFTIDQHPDGITLTRPLRATPVLAAGLLLTALFFGLGTFGSVMAMRSESPLDWWVAVLAIAGVAVLGGLCLMAITHVPFTRRRLVHLSVRGGNLTVFNSPHRPWGLRWTAQAPREFRARLGGIDLLRRVRIAHLLVVTASGRSRLLLSDLPQRECDWAIGHLNAALAASRQESASGRVGSATLSTPSGSQGC